MAVVAITHNDDIEVAIDEALGFLDLKSIVEGRNLAVKPNETSSTPEDTCGVTQADTLRGVVRYIKGLRPKSIVVTGGAGSSQTDEVFRDTGMDKVLEEQGIEFFDHNRPPFTTVDLEYAHDKDVEGPQESVVVNPRVLEYETLVSLSQLKVHSTATVTLCLKNIAMSYPAADHYGHPRSKQAHENEFFKDMHSFIAAMARRFPIGLGIIVGHPAMVGKGPLGGHTVETGLVIASTDALAADVVGAQVLGFDVQAVRHLWEAKALGLGETDLEKMNFPGLSFEDAYSIFTEAVYGKPLDRS